MTVAAPCAYLLPSAELLTQLPVPQREHEENKRTPEAERGHPSKATHPGSKQGCVSRKSGTEGTKKVGEVFFSCSRQLSFKTGLGPAFYLRAQAFTN